MSGKDAVFLSPHKFIGGPGTPGVLVVKRALLRNRVPSVPGGGTVLFVTPSSHSYHPDPVIREEGGTPGIVGVDPRRPRVRAQGARSAPRRSAAASTTCARRALRVLGREPEHRDPRQHEDRAAADRVARAASPCAPAARELRRRACSATCSGSRRAAVASAPAPTCTGSTSVDDRFSALMHAEVAKGHLGAKLGVHPAHLQLLHQRSGVRSTSSTPSTCLPRRMEAAAAVQLRSRHRSLAPSRCGFRSSGEPEHGDRERTAAAVRDRS